MAFLHFTPDLGLHALEGEAGPGGVKGDASHDEEFEFDCGVERGGWDVDVVR